MSGCYIDASSSPCSSLCCASGHEVSSQIVQQGLGVCRGKLPSASGKTERSNFPLERGEGSFLQGLGQLRSLGGLWPWVETE